MKTQESYICKIHNKELILVNGFDSKLFCDQKIKFNKVNYICFGLDTKTNTQYSYQLYNNLLYYIQSDKKNTQIIIYSKNNTFVKHFKFEYHVSPNTPIETLIDYMVIA